jgi:type II secretory pathway component PulF
MLFWFGRHGLTVLGIGAAFLVASAFGFRLLGRIYGSSYWVPVWGRIMRSRDLSLVCAAMALRLKAGATIPDALGDARAALSNGAGRRVLDRVRSRVEEGGKLSEAMFYERFFPRTLAWAVSLGESRDETPDVLRTFAETYSDELQWDFEVAQAMLTPIGIFVMANLVGLFAAGMLMPLFGLIRALSGGL